jgi:hypothetical protein
LDLPRNTNADWHNQCDERECYPDPFKHMPLAFYVYVHYNMLGLPLNPYQYAHRPVLYHYLRRVHLVVCYHQTSVIYLHYVIIIKPKTRAT